MTMTCDQLDSFSSSPNPFSSTQASTIMVMGALVGRCTIYMDAEGMRKIVVQVHTRMQNCHIYTGRSSRYIYRGGGVPRPPDR